MRLTNGFDISASALTAQRLRLDVISANIANADTTRGQLVDGRWTPYQRKLVTMEPQGANGSFAQMFQSSLKGQGPSPAGGVKVTRISNDPTPFKLVHNPSHPDADENGYVLLPNVDLLKEMVDLMSASRSYDANVTALNASKAMITKAMEIGK